MLTFNKLTDKVKHLLGGVPQSLNQIGNYIQPKVSSPVPQYNNPTQTIGYKVNNVARTILKPLAQAQSFIESPTPVRVLPTFNAPQSKHRGLNPILKAGTGVANIAGGIANNIVANGVINPAIDIGRLAGRTISGQGLPQYNSLKSAPARLGYNVMGINRTPQQVIGNIAGTSLPAIDAYGGGKVFGIGKNIATSTVKQGVKTAIKKGSIEGLKQGGVSGFVQGLSDNREAPTLFKQLFEAGKQGIGSAAVGAVVGGGIGATGAIANRLRSVVADAFINKNPKVSATEAYNAADKFIRDEFGRFAKGVRNKKEPVFYSDLRESLGLPRNGDYRSGFADFNEIANIGNQSKTSIPEQQQLGKLGFSLKQIEAMTPEKRQTIINSGMSGIKKLERNNFTDKKEFSQLDREAENALKEELGLKSASQFQKELNSQQKGTFNKGYSLANNALEQRYDLRTPKEYGKYQESRMKVGERSQQKFNKVGDEALHANYNTISNEGRGGLKVPPEIFASAKNWKDKGTFWLNRETPTRNIEEVAGTGSKQVKEFFFNKVKDNELSAANWVEATKKTIKDNIISKLGIKPNSSEDRLTMLYGEGKVSLDELKLETKKWEQVVEADKYFRSFYDDTLNKINTVITKFGYDPVPKRKNYYTHYQELGTIFDSLGTILNTETLPRDINGLTVDFKPGKEFFKFSQPRLGDTTKESAIGAVETYLRPAANQIFHTDSVQRGRALENVVGDALRSRDNVDPKHLSNFFGWLRDYTNTLAGKKTLSARGAEGVFGRKVFSVVNAIKGQSSANMIGGNISSALTNLIPAFTQAPATMDKPSYIKGLTKALLSPMKEGNDFVVDGVQSSFLRRRFGSDKLAPTKIQAARETAGALFEAIDKFTSNTVVGGKYLEGLKKGLSPEAAMRRADDYASRMMGDRSFGQAPQIFQNQGILSLFTQFQLEVNNQLSFLLKDVPRNSPNRAQLTSRVTQILLFSYLFNEAYVRVAGRRPAFDPIGVAIDSYKELKSDRTPGEKTLSIAGKVGDQLPFTSMITGGGRIPTFAGLKGIKETIDDPMGSSLKFITNYVSPAGGGQVYKSVEGLNAYAKGGVYTPKGNLKYPIKQDIPNLARTALFGKASTPEAVEYYSKRPDTLLEKDTKRVTASSNPAETYKQIQERKQQQSVVNKRKEDIKSEKSSREENILGFELPHREGGIPSRTEIEFRRPNATEKTLGGIMDLPILNWFKGKDKEVSTPQTVTGTDLGSTLEKVMQEQEMKSEAKSLVKDYLTYGMGKKEDIDKILREEYNTNIDDVQWSIVDSLPTEEKAQIAVTFIKNGDYEANVTTLLDKEILTNDVVEKMFEGNQITEEEAQTLKAVIKQYKISKGILKGGSGRKAKISMPKIKASTVPRIKLSSIKLPKIHIKKTKLHLKKKKRTMRIKV